MQKIAADSPVKQPIEYRRLPKASKVGDFCSPVKEPVEYQRLSKASKTGYSETVKTKMAAASPVKECVGHQRVPNVSERSVLKAYTEMATHGYSPVKDEAGY